MLTDSKPCVQAHLKLQRGEFSSSARVYTFLSTLSRFSVSLQHISGAANLPSDYLSRNPMECDDKSCQICTFISECSEIPVRKVAISDILSGRQPMLFKSRNAWKKSQHDCASLWWTWLIVLTLLRVLVLPEKTNKINDVKRYFNIVTMSRDSLVVVKKTMPFAKPRELIVVPRAVAPGLLTALHLRFDHPTKSQLSKVFNRHFLH